MSVDYCYNNWIYKNFLSLIGPGCATVTGQNTVQFLILYNIAN